MNFAEIKAKLDNVAGDTVKAGNRFTSGVAAISQANAALGNMPSTYGDLVAAINAGYAGDPTNVAWAAAKAEMDLLVAAFQALRADVQAAVDALAAL